MAFIDVLQEYDIEAVQRKIDSCTAEDVKAVLAKDEIDEEDYLVLLSPAAEGFLEEMARKAQTLKIQYFGYSVELFTPMYIANYCDNLCVYCGFKHTNKINRKRLTMEEIAEEGKAIAATGLEHLLILTGESQEYSDVNYILSAVEVLKKQFASVAMEIYALSEADYRRCAEAGVDGMTMFQEVYNEKRYKQLHLQGPKKDFAYRLDAPERACRAKMRVVNIGALLGLDPWRREAFFTGLHAHYLQKKYKRVQIAVSTPRIRPCVGGFPPKEVVKDKNVVQYITALRIFMPQIGITISSRESRVMRDHLVSLGVTKMSAGVTTAVGGHTSNDSGEQFNISDDRSVDEMAAMIYAQGYQPVFKDWMQL